MYILEFLGACVYESIATVLVQMNIQTIEMVKYYVVLF